RQCRALLGEVQASLTLTITRAEDSGPLPLRIMTRPARHLNRPPLRRSRSAYPFDLSRRPFAISNAVETTLFLLHKNVMTSQRADLAVCGRAAFSVVPNDANGVLT
ncbi:MAG: hypothetical protein WD065_04370, partial [Planctomycetaceae bacterium]